MYGIRFDQFSALGGCVAFVNLGCNLCVILGQPSLLFVKHGDCALHKFVHRLVGASLDVLLNQFFQLGLEADFHETFYPTPFHHSRLSPGDPGELRYRTPFDFARGCGKTGQAREGARFPQWQSFLPVLVAFRLNHAEPIPERVLFALFAKAGAFQSSFRTKIPAPSASLRAGSVSPRNQRDKRRAPS